MSSVVVEPERKRRGEGKKEQQEKKKSVACHSPRSQLEVRHAIVSVIPAVDAAAAAFRSLHFMKSYRNSVNEVAPPPDFGGVHFDICRNFYTFQ